MTSFVTEEDEENLRKKCEDASLEDEPQHPKKADQKAVLPPIKLGMSFSDWKQMKEEEESKLRKSAKNRRPNIQQQRQNQRNYSSNFNNQLYNQQNNNYNIPYYLQQQNFSDFDTFPQRQRNGLNIFEELLSTSFFEPNFQDQQWSSGPLMQSMFPPMPRMPRLNESAQKNNRPVAHKRPTPSSNVEPKTEKVNPTQSQIYIQRPHQGNGKFKSDWIPKPQPPPPMIAVTPEQREEKSRLWREYRLAMKPFKNRDFLNAKRVQQRLGKKRFEEMNEKDRARLDRAMETINSHKAMLTERMIQRSTKVAEQMKIEKGLNQTLQTFSNPTILRILRQAKERNAWSNTQSY